MRFLFAAILILGSMGAERASAAAPFDARAIEEDGFGRLVFSWPRKEGKTSIPEHREAIAAGVLVLTFTEPVSVDLDHILTRMPRYFSLVRQDADGRTLRFAMKAAFSLNVMEAGHELYVDLLPPNWRKALPSLPAETIARLKAENAVLAAKEEEVKAAEEIIALEVERQMLELRVGEHENFSRLAFSWGQPVLYSVARGMGSVTLTFDRAADLSLAQLRIDPPPFIKGARSHVTDGRLVVRIDTEPGMTTRDFREDLNIVVDVGPARKVSAMGWASGKPAAEWPIEQALPEGAVILEDAPEDVTAEAPELEADPESVSETIALLANAPQKEPLDDGGAEEVVVAEALGQEAPGDKEQTNKAPAAVAAPAFAPAVVADTASETDDVSRAALPEETDGRLAADMVAAEEILDELAAQDKTEAVAEALAEVLAEADVDVDVAAAEAEVIAMDGPLLVETELMGNSVRMTFPWTDHVAAAVFERAGYLWVVFDQAATFDLSEISDEVQAIIGKPSIMEMTAGSVLRFALPRRSLITASEKETRWVVMVGDVLLEPAVPVSVERSWTENGEARVKMVLEGASPVRWIKDPVVQDMMAVITAPGPVRGLLTAHSFVEFQALTTAQGLAFVPLADDLLVHVSQGLVSVSRQQGLLLSAGGEADRIGDITVSDPRRLGFMDFPRWRAEVPGDTFTETRQHFLQRFATVPEDELQGVRFEYAKYLLAQGLAPEALVVMQLAEQDQADIVLNPAFRALRGVARYMARHPKTAVSDLSVRRLERDRHAVLWRAMVHAELGNWRSASADFELGETAIEMYEPDLRARFRVMAAQTALAVDEIDVAAFHLDEIPESATDLKWLREAELVRAAMLVRQDKSGEALEIYDRLAGNPARETVARARYAQISVMHTMGVLGDEEMIVALDRLRYMWRGDELELKVLTRLGRLQVAHGDMGEGLKTMRTAVSLYYETELGRQLASEMTNIFANLFIEGGADTMAPVKALSLYYDFRELTPIGRRGDEMIRHLADRLVAVDLLEQAAALLQHQVSHRLRGIARAQVATRLAAIYLMDQKPEKAMIAIRSSRQTLLPRQVVEARHLIEARALSQLKLFDNALELIAEMDSEDAETTRTEVLWTAQRWSEAGGQIEAVLGASWSTREVLDDETRFQVMRGVVAYTLAGDENGVQRMRSKFGELMRKSPDADSFAILTEPVEKQNVRVGELARAIADVDTFDRFLAKFRDGYQSSLGDAPETVIN